MNKKAWLIILAVTSAVTVFALCSTWVLRPNSSTAAYADQVFQEAKERQNSSIVSVSEPLKTNVDEMSEEDRLVSKVVALLSVDDAFLTNTANKIKADIDDELDSWGSDYRDEILKEVEKEGDSYKAEINEELNAKEAELLSYLDSHLADSKSYSDQLAESIKSYIDSSVVSAKEYIDSEIDKNVLLAKEYIDGEIDTNVALAEDYINTYAESFAKDSEDGLSSVLDSAKLYADDLATQVKEYIDSKISSDVAKTETKPVLNVSEQEKVEEVVEPAVPFEILRDVQLSDGIVSIEAHNGYSKIVFPTETAKEDIEYVLTSLSDMYPAIEGIVRFYPSRNEVMAIYSQLVSEDDILYGVNAVETAIKALDNKPVVAEPVIEEVKEPEEVVADIEEETVEPEITKPEPVEEIETDEIEEVEKVIPVIEKDPYDFDLEMEVPLFDDVVYISAKKDIATFAFPEFVDDEIIYDALVMLIEEYPDETKEFDFSVDNKVITVIFGNDYTENEVKGYIEFLVSFYSARLDRFIPAVAAEETTETTEGIEKVVIDIYREIPLFDENVIIKATNDSAIISLPSFVTEEDIADGLAYLYGTYPEEIADFDFVLENNSVSVDYSDIYTEDELNSYIDSAVYAIGQYIDSMANPTVNIHREVPLFEGVVTIDAYNTSARISFPVFVSEQDIISGVDYLRSIYPDETSLFSFNANGELLDITYKDEYTEDELSGYIDSVIYIIEDYINKLSVPSIPSTPVFEDVERDLVEGTRVPVAPAFGTIERNIIEPRIPSAPTIISTTPTELSIFPNPEIAEDDIPEIRNIIRNIEVERYLNLL